MDEMKSKSLRKEKLGWLKIVVLFFIKSSIQILSRTNRSHSVVAAQYKASGTTCSILVECYLETSGIMEFCKF